jgi:hypothetical protein
MQGVVSQLLAASQLGDLDYLILVRCSHARPGVAAADDQPVGRSGLPHRRFSSWHRRHPAHSVSGRIFLFFLFFGTSDIQASLCQVELFGGFFLAPATSSSLCVRGLLHVVADGH